jgi:glycosyltransferase involved in cell wall biosynthesis
LDLHIVALNQFYAPDTAPTGQHLADLARELVARGHRVTVLASRRSYAGDREYPREEVLDGVRVRRLPTLAHGRQREGRLGSWLGFYAAAFAFLFSRRLRADLLLCMTTPPYLGLLATMRGRASRTPVAHWVMDVYPDALFAHGMASPDGVTAGILRSLARWSNRSASLVLTLGPFMQAVASRHASARTPLASVPLWGADSAVSADDVARVRRERGWGESDVVFLYSGNMGLGHRLGEFLEAARTGQPRQALWCFLGGGARRGEVENAARALAGARIQVLPYVAPSELGASLAAADVHLVSLRREWQGLIVPSKLQAAFSVGRPVVLVGPEENEPAEWIRASGGGWHAGEGDVEGLLACVREACVPAARAERAARALAFAREHFSRERNCARIADLLEQAAGARPGSG